MRARHHDLVAMGTYRSGTLQGRLLRNQGRHTQRPPHRPGPVGSPGRLDHRAVPARAADAAGGVAGRAAVVVERRRIGPVIRELERSVDPLFRRVGIHLTDEGGEADLYSRQG
jgi:hypothetical protein